MTEERRRELSSRRTARRSRGTPPSCERRADDAERELVQWKKVRFMADKVGDEFEGYITGVAAFGLFIELIEHFVEGLGARLDDGRRLLPVRRARTSCAARTPARSTGSATA